MKVDFSETSFLESSCTDETGPGRESSMILPISFGGRLAARLKSA